MAMRNHYLVMKWHYDYDKEGTWFDEDDGCEQYEIKEGASYSLPHMHGKTLTIQSVKECDGTVEACIHAGYESYTVKSGGDPVEGYVHHDYSAAGDSVSTSLYMTFTVT